MARCPICGNESKGICKSCREGEIEIVDKPISVCANCNALNIANKWKKEKDLDSALIDGINRNMKKGRKIRTVKRTVNHKIGPGVNVSVKCMVSDKDVEFPMIIKVSFTQCHLCSKLLNKTYFEGTFQYRGKDKEIERFIEDETERNLSKGIKIVKKQKSKDGIDYNFNSAKFMTNLARKAAEKYGGIIRESKRLFSRNRQTSKDIYRINILYIGPEFKEGDVILLKNDKERLILVKSIIRNNIKGIDLINSKKAACSFDENTKIKVLKKKNFQITQTKPAIYAIDPDNFQNIEVEYAISDIIVSIDKKYKGVVYSKKAFITG